MNMISAIIAYVPLRWKWWMNDHDAARDILAWIAGLVGVLLPSLPQFRYD